MQAQRTGSMSTLRLSAAIHNLSESPPAMAAALAFCAALFSALAFSFYPLWLALPLAFAIAALAYFRPLPAAILCLLVPLPLLASRSPAVAWPYAILAGGLALFELRANWPMFLLVLAAAFAPFVPLPYFGLFAIPLLALGALHLGSRRSLYLCAAVVLSVSLLSGALGISHSLPIAVLSPLPAPLIAVPSPSLPSDFVPALAGALLGMASFEGLARGAAGFANLGFMLLNYLLSQPLILNLAVWMGAFYALPYLSAQIKGKYAQSLSGLALLILPAGALSAALLYGLPPLPLLLPALAGWLVAQALLLWADRMDIHVSREAELRAKKTEQQFSKFGLESMDDSSGPASLNDVGGYADVKQELLEAISLPINRREYSEAYGIKPASGILLFGPPGTGKTFLISALARQVKMKFFYVKCSDLLSSWYGESERNISELFETARKNAPTILFFDEIDAIAKSRQSYFADDVGPRILSVMLAEMDGFKKVRSKPVIIVGATNTPQTLDAAIMRPGRLDKIIYMPLPGADAREAIFKVHLRKMPLAQDVAVSELAKATAGYSGADIANIVSEAARLAAREARAKDQLVPVSKKHFLSVLGRIRPSTTEQQVAQYLQFQEQFERRSG